MYMWVLCVSDMKERRGGRGRGHVRSIFHTRLGAIQRGLLRWRATAAKMVNLYLNHNIKSKNIIDTKSRHPLYGKKNIIDTKSRHPLYGKKSVTQCSSHSAVSIHRRTALKFQRHSAPEPHKSPLSPVRPRRQSQSATSSRTHSDGLTNPTATAAAPASGRSRRVFFSPIAASLP
jgi:hypothetical protein